MTSSNTLKYVVSESLNPCGKFIKHFIRDNQFNTRSLFCGDNGMLCSECKKKQLNSGEAIPPTSKDEGILARVL